MDKSKSAHTPTDPSEQRLSTPTTQPVQNNVLGHFVLLLWFVYGCDRVEDEEDMGSSLLFVCHLVPVCGGEKL